MNGSQSKINPTKEEQEPLENDIQLNQRQTCGLKKSLQQRLGVGMLALSQENLLASEQSLTLPVSNLSHQSLKNLPNHYCPTLNSSSRSFRTGHKTRNKLSSNSCTIDHRAQNFMSLVGQTLSQDEASTSMLSTPLSPHHEPLTSTRRSLGTWSSPMEYQRQPQRRLLHKSNGTQHGTEQRKPSGLLSLSDRLNLIPTPNTSMNNLTNSWKVTMDKSFDITNQSDLELGTLKSTSCLILNVSKTSTVLTSLLVGDCTMTTYFSHLVT